MAAVAQAENRSFLHNLHESLGAKFGPFGGWLLPLYYSSILEEHQAVRTAVGLFDVSHLGHLEVRGEGAAGRLSLLVTQDLSRLQISGACYTPMLSPEGFILDEMILYRLPPSPGWGEGRGEGDRFRLVVNAANGDKVLGWLKDHLPAALSVLDLRRKVGTLAVQGPRAVAALEKISGRPLAKSARYTLFPIKLFGKELHLARTGYTGEDGGELFVPVEDLELIWNGLLKEGKDFGIKPIGLGARDTLRLEAGLPLGGADLDATTTPLEAALEWTISWDKGDFIGKEALERQRKSGLTRRLVGFELTGAGIPRHGYPIKKEDVAIGQVTSGTLSPTLHRAIGMGFVTPAASQPGTALSVEIHGREVNAVVVKLPFYHRK